MKIKNTKELRLRANAHAKYDHIKQGTYGDGKVNGKIEYEGCAIGCLSTPHRKRDLRRFLKENLCSGRWEESWMRRQLGEEFGITRPLAEAAEAFFEAQPTHGAAINFVRDFAHSLPEGADIRPRDINRFMERPSGYGWSWGAYQSYRTDEFLEWLKSRG